MSWLNWDAPQLGGGGQRPPSFGIRYRDAWAAWVLDRGVPMPPAASVGSEMVPVAHWAGSDRGLVCFVGGCEHDALCQSAPPHRVLAPAAPRTTGPFEGGDDRQTFHVTGLADPAQIRAIDVRQASTVIWQPMPMSGVFVIGVDGRHPANLWFLDHDGVAADS